MFLLYPLYCITKEIESTLAKYSSKAIPILTSTAGPGYAGRIVTHLFQISLVATRTADLQHCLQPRSYLDAFSSLEIIQEEELAVGHTRHVLQAILKV